MRRLPLLLLLLLAGCDDAPTQMSKEVAPQSRLTLVEHYSTPSSEPDFFIYHDTVSGSDMVFFRYGDAGGALVLPPKPQ